MASEAKKGPAKSAPNEGLFGRIAVSLGFISEQQLQDCLTEQGQAKHEGRELRVGQILLKHRWLTTTQFLRVMSEQESRSGDSESRPTMVRGEIDAASKDEVPSRIEPVSQIMPGRTLGRYEILRQIGRGGMGVVYEARDTLLKRRVALKVLREDMVDPMMGRRLEKEAVTAARLKHPNIITLYEAGVVEGVRYLSMEYVEGKSLRDAMDSEMSVTRKVELVEQVARAVDYAHGRGVIHRDLKPGNVMIDVEGRPMVMDFGLARMMDDFTHASRAGALVGTPGYMAPEQIMGSSADVTAKTDVYALGVILYELLSGQLPFDGMNPSEVCTKILETEAPKLVGVPSDLEAVVRKAMHRDRNLRYSTSGEFADDLKRFREGEPVRAAPITLRKTLFRLIRQHRTATTVVLVAVLFLLAGLGAWSFIRWRREGDLRRKRDEARAAEARGDWETAFRLWSGLEQSGDSAAGGSAREASRRLELSRETARAIQFRADILEAEKDRRKLRSDLEAVEAQLREESARVEPHDPALKKQILWRLERRRDELQAGVERKESRLLQLHYSLLRTEPSAISGLVAFLWSLLRQAEEEGDLPRARRHEEALRHLVEERGLAEERRNLERGGTVTLLTEPPGAEIELSALGELPDRADRRLEEVSRKAWGRTPIHSQALSPGSYVLVLKKNGYRDIRLPVLVTRGQGVSATVPMFKDADIGPEFVYIPGGEFISGDPKAYMGGSRRTRVFVKGFFVSQHELTVEEYAEFLNDRQSHPLEEAKRHVPRHSAGDLRHAKIVGDRIELIEPGREGKSTPMDPKLAVHEIDDHDAKEYCEWRTTRSKRSGENAVYRLPTALEWEKAARGVDGRAFVWGEYFDWSFTTGYYSADPPPPPRRVGSVPTDKSVYGVLDMAGNLLEWTDEWFDPQTQRYKIVSGGSHGLTDEVNFRAAARRPYPHGKVPNSVGIRVVKELPKR